MWDGTIDMRETKTGSAMWPITLGRQKRQNAQQRAVGHAGALPVVGPSWAWRELVGQRRRVLRRRPLRGWLRLGEVRGAHRPWQLPARPCASL